MTKIIALDAGHGLRTSGKQTPDGIKEWTLNDKVRDKVVEMLKGYDVKFLFPDNNEGYTDESLASRLNYYMSRNADVMVSIHHNAFTGNWNSATGVSVFTDRGPTAKDTKLAKCIYDRMVKYTGLRGRGILAENWYVINQDRIPAVLLEGGFMDSTKDYKIITSDEGQTNYARAVAEGLIEFLGLEKKDDSCDGPASSPTPESSSKPATSTIKKYPPVPFSVQVLIDDLNYRSEPSMKGKVKGVTKKGVFTITKFQNGWGKLKSGEGWIYLENPEYCKILGTVKEESKKEEPKDTSFKVKVEISNLNIRKGPGTNYDRTGKLTGVGTFTIVEQKSGKGSDSGWGKLKSGEGWISLDFAKKL